MQAELPAAWKSFVSYKAGNIIAFLDSLMNSVLYRDKYDELSDHVAKGLNVYQAFSGCRADDLVECDTFLSSGSGAGQVADGAASCRGYRGQSST